MWVFEPHCILYLLLELIMQIREHNRLSVLTKKEANKSATREELRELEALEFKLIDQLNERELDEANPFLK